MFLVEYLKFKEKLRRYFSSFISCSSLLWLWFWAGWTNVKSFEKKKRNFLLIDRRSNARSIFCVLMIADFSRSSSLEGISSAKNNRRKKREREKKKDFHFSGKLWNFFLKFSVIAKFLIWGKFEFFFLQFSAFRKEEKTFWIQRSVEWLKKSKSFEESQAKRKEGKQFCNSFEIKKKISSPVVVKIE